MEISATTEDTFHSARTECQELMPLKAQVGSTDDL